MGKDGRWKDPHFHEQDILERKAVFRSAKDDKVLISHQPPPLTTVSFRWSPEPQSYQKEKEEEETRWKAWFTYIQRIFHLLLARRTPLQKSTPKHVQFRFRGMCSIYDLRGTFLVVVCVQRNLWSDQLCQTTFVWRPLLVERKIWILLGLLMPARANFDGIPSHKLFLGVNVSLTRVLLV